MYREYDFSGKFRTYFVTVSHYPERRVHFLKKLATLKLISSVYSEMRHFSWNLKSKYILSGYWTLWEIPSKGNSLEMVYTIFHLPVMEKFHLDGTAVHALFRLTREFIVDTNTSPQYFTVRVQMSTISGEVFSTTVLPLMHEGPENTFLIFRTTE